MFLIKEINCSIHTQRMGKQVGLKMVFQMFECNAPQLVAMAQLMPVVSAKAVIIHLRLF